MITSVWIFLSIIIGLIGAGKEIGFKWAFMVALILSPIFGLRIVLLSKSKKNSDYLKELSDDKKIYPEKNLLSLLPKEELERLRQCKERGDLPEAKYNIMRGKILN